MVYRIYVAKKTEFAQDDKHLLQDIRTNLGIKELTGIKIYNRYDCEGIGKKVFDSCVHSVFSEPQVDNTYTKINIDKQICFGIEYLPGQFDQRSDSAAQCIQFITSSTKPLVRWAKIICLQGKISACQLTKIQNYVINPVESRIASLDKPQTLKMDTETPKKTPVISGFCDMKAADMKKFIDTYSLSMDESDVVFCQNYFKNTEKRDPTLTELKVIDTYWSDHCRHTTFMTHLAKIKIDNPTVEMSFNKYLELRDELYGKDTDRPFTLMDLATIGAKYLKRTGKLKNTDDSDEINACSVKIDAVVDGKKEKWLLMFKNETHNHPTEIEPFGGAATCLGGAIRDPLSGRSYVYQAMRVTGAANPLLPVSDTMKGKLAQSKICRTAAAGYSSYGNQIGLATGHVSEVYHPSFVAKRMEVGAVVGAAPAKNVVRKTPDSTDVVILLGGATGRDGCGGATGSSKAHDTQSLSNCGAEVQKGNAPEERKIQRLFRNAEATKLIKRCNDFGAGGISVAIGELTDGLDIYLDRAPKKYEGLTATELAISESQERMAIVVPRKHAQKFVRMATKENLKATIVADVTDTNRLRMYMGDESVLDLSRDFLNSNGASKTANIEVNGEKSAKKVEKQSIKDRFNFTMSSLNVASQKGLVERFDSTIGSGSVLLPFGGKYQSTPTQAMVAKLPVERGDTTTCSVFAYGYDPFLAEQSPYYGAYYAVISSVAKMVAAGGDMCQAWLSFQEYFERLKKEPKRWGKPFAALLGALQAQLDLGLGAIGGKDSMSGTFENIDVPPTLVSFVCSVTDCKNIISPEFKKAGSSIYLISPDMRENGLYDEKNLLLTFKKIQKSIALGEIVSAYAIGSGGVCEAVSKMCFGNKIGARLLSKLTEDELFDKQYGAFVVETPDKLCYGRKIGETTTDYLLTYKCDEIELARAEEMWADTLETIYPTKLTNEVKSIENINYKAKNIVIASEKFAKPRVLIPVFPGTNCEYDTAKAFERAGGTAEIFVVNNMSGKHISGSIKKLATSIKNSQIMAFPGGFSGGDEPDGSAKFIVSLMRNAQLTEEIMSLLNQRDGLMCGICNGFQALIKLGLLPYGKITAPNKNAPTLTFNSIGRHQSRLVHTRVCSNLSPWLMHHDVGDIHTIAVSHGEGRFIASQSVLDELIANGQVATQYVDINGVPTDDIQYNPNNSTLAIEGITSADGRIFGKMAHSERAGEFLYKNVPDAKTQRMFEGAIDYYK